MVSEAQLRDQLAVNLGVLEEGLILIEKEHRLVNPIGAKGFVDILACDKYGNRVLIELKRSNTAARQALHELCKYIALFRINYGLPAHQIRCFVVSTEWHELIVPFAEFAQTAEYQVEGFVLAVAQSGTIISASRVSLPKLPEAQSLATQHLILLFKSVDKRNEAIPRVERALNACGAESFVIVLMKYEGNVPDIIPAALYIVPGRIKFKIITENELEEGCEDDEAPDDEAPIEEYFFAAFLHWMQFPPRHDDCEIGYPDKFLSMQQQGWACEGIRRYGQWSSEAAATDDELYRLIGGEEGTNTIIYHRMSSPHLHLHWQDFQRQAALCLAGNEAWTCGFKHICSLAEEMSAQASMTISIYNPMNWPLSLFKWIVNDDRNYLPAFEAIATTADRGLALVGVTRWDGITKIDSVRLLFMALGCIDMLGFLAFWHRGAAWELDTDLMACLGLSYQMVLLEFRSGVEPSTTLLSYEDGSLVAVPDVQRGRSLEEFVRENQQFLLKLTAEISSVAWGL